MLVVGCVPVVWISLNLDFSSSKMMPSTLKFLDGWLETTVIDSDLGSDIRFVIESRSSNSVHVIEDALYLS